MGADAMTETGTVFDCSGEQLVGVVHMPPGAAPATAGVVTTNQVVPTDSIPLGSGPIRIGITAGASAPEVLVEEIIEAFASRRQIEVEVVTTAVETMHFPLPRELRETA